MNFTRSTSLTARSISACGSDPSRTQSTSAFWKITFPLSVPGVIAGCLLVFIPAVGEFVIPDLLGGSGVLMIGKTIWTEFFSDRDWPMSAALTVIMVAVLVLPVLVLQQVVGKVDASDMGPAS